MNLFDQENESGNATDLLNELMSEVGENADESITDAADNTENVSIEEDTASYEDNHDEALEPEQEAAETSTEEATPTAEAAPAEEDENLEPETRVGLAIYMAAMAVGKMTEQGVLIPNALNMTQIAYQAEVSVNYAIKAMANIRKAGLIKNRHEDGRLIIKLDELTVWLKEEGAAVEE